MLSVSKLYDEYVDTFRSADGTLPEMMELKRFHTAKVVENASLIVEGENFPEEWKEPALIAALLHDTGRYEQLKRYNTFQDSKSVDHAVFSHDIVKEWELESLVGEWREPILKAVLYHNRRELPEGLDEKTAALSKVVRDADKLDIFRVLEERLDLADWRKAKTEFWGLDPMGKPSAEVLSAIRERRPVDYQHIRSLADFILIQIGWIFSGLYYEKSRIIARERGHLKYRLNFLEKNLNFRLDF